MIVMVKTLKILRARRRGRRGSASACDHCRGRRNYRQACRGRCVTGECRYCRDGASSQPPGAGKRSAQEGEDRPYHAPSRSEKDPALPSAAPIITTEPQRPAVPVPASTPTMELFLSVKCGIIRTNDGAQDQPREGGRESQEAEQRSAALSLELAKSQERCQSLASHQRRTEEDISSMRSELQAAHGGVAELKMQLVQRRLRLGRKRNRALEQEARDPRGRLHATARVVSEVEVQEKEQEILRLEGALQEQQQRWRARRRCVRS